MKERIKRTGKFALRKGKLMMMLLGIVILGLLIKKVGVSDLLRIISEMSPWYVVLAIIPWMLNLAVGAYRLKKLVGAGISSYEMFRIFCYGYLLNYASPIQGFGAGAKIAMLRMKQVKVSKSSASVGSEIGYDIIFTLVIVALFFVHNLEFVVSQLQSILDIRLFYAGGVLVAAALAAALLLRKNGFIIEFFSHIKDSFRLKRMASIMPMTLLMWLLPAIVVYLFFIAVGQHVSLWIILGSLCIGFIFGLASFIPGGLGVRDAITAYVYSLSGVPLETTIAIAIFNRLFTIGTVLLFAISVRLFERR